MAVRLAAETGWFSLYKFSLYNMTVRLVAATGWFSLYNMTNTGHLRQTLLGVFC